MIVRLSSPVTDLKGHYEVVVVGSGYGGAIAASRLARAGRRVCLLERGKELVPGEYPETGPEAQREVQTSTFRTWSGWPSRSHSSMARRTPASYPRALRTRWSSCSSTTARSSTGAT
jgi:choline dehydrogenase-like flavoprotein